MAVGQIYMGGDLNIEGDLIADTLSIRSGNFAAGWVNSSSQIKYEYVVHEKALVTNQPHGTAIVARTEVIYIATASGVVESFEAVITGVIPGGDTVTVDLQKSTGGAAFATMLSAAISFTSGTTTIRVPLAGTLSSTTFVDGDLLAVVVTASGSTAQGLSVVCNISQGPTP